MLYELVPFRSFEQDEVYSCFTSILESFGSFDDADRADSAEWFSSSAAQLACYAERAGIGGNVWTAWLAKLFAEAENPFSLAHERRDASGGTMDGLAMQDMEQLYFYLKYDYAKLEKRMNVNMLRRFGKDFKPSACGAPSLERTAGAVIAELAASMEKAASPAELYKAVTDFYHAHGAGRFALYNGFRWDDKAREIVPAAPLEDITFDKLFGYEEQKRALIDNTVAFLEGRPANNVLLYGEGGTGKSSSIKALLNEYAPRGLRIPRRSGMAKAVLIELNPAAPEGGNHGVQVWERLLLRIRKGPFAVIAPEKRGEDQARLLPGDLLGVIHEPRFKNRLHHRVVVEHGVAAAVEIEHADFAVSGLIQVAVADIPLHGVFRFVFKHANPL